MNMVVSRAAADLGEILSITGVELSSLNPIMGNNSVYLITDGTFNGAIAPCRLSDQVRAALIASGKDAFPHGERSGLILVGRGAELHLSLSELRSLRASQSC